MRILSIQRDLSKMDIVGTFLNTEVSSFRGFFVHTCVIWDCNQMSLIERCSLEVFFTRGPIVMFNKGMLNYDSN